MPELQLREADAVGSRVAELLGQLGYTSPAHDVAERLADLGRSPNDHVLVAVIDTQVVGVVSLNMARARPAALISR